jgi:hypothetical protein
MLCFNTGDREHHVWVFKQCPANDPFRFEHVSYRLEARFSKKALLEFRLIGLPAFKIGSLLGRSFGGIARLSSYRGGCKDEKNSQEFHAEMISGHAVLASGIMIAVAKGFPFAPTLLRWEITAWVMQKAVAECQLPDGAFPKAA